MRLRPLYILTAALIFLFIIVENTEGSPRWDSQPICPEGSIWSQRKKQCVNLYKCPVGTVWSTHSKRCIDLKYIGIINNY